MSLDNFLREMKMYLFVFISLDAINIVTMSQNNLRVYRTFQRDPECKLSLIHICSVHIHYLAHS